MSEIRSVSVHLDADVASYIAKMKLAGAETDRAFGRGNTTGITGLTTSLKGVEAQQQKVSASTRRMGQDLEKTRVKVDDGSKSIDRYSGRLGIWLDAILGFGPALIPVAAEAVPLTAALGTNLLAVGAGVGVAKLAFAGVGTALGAINKAQLEPTTANLQAADQALQALPPDARKFTQELAAMRPELDRLRGLAGQGLFPGASDGLQALSADLPIVRSGIKGISAELGNLASQAGHSLASDRWQPFLKFVAHEAPVGLGVMGHAVGDVAHGLSQLLMDFTPLTHDLDRGILRVAADFDRWATSVGRTKGFQDFLTYLSTNGPRVVNLLGDTAKALLDVAVAAAPLGGPVIDALDAVARVIDAIARSNLGGPLFTGIVALRLFTRAEQLWATTSTSAVGRFIAGQREAVMAIRATSSAQARAAMTGSELAAAQTRSAAGWGTLRGGALKGGAALAGFGLIASGATDKLHLTNTATLAMAGSMVGPWGTAIGAGVGLLLDFKGSQDKSAAATADFTSTLNQQTGAITQNTTAMAAKVLQEDGAFESAKKLGIGLDVITAAATGNKAALAEVNGQLSYFLHQTSPGYTAGGANIVDPEQTKAARDLANELGVVGGRVTDAQGKTRELAQATRRSAYAAHEAAKAHRNLGSSLKAEGNAAAQALQAWKPFGTSLNDAHKSLQQFIHDLAAQARALAQFGQNAENAARKGLDQGLIKSLRDAGPEGALRMRQLANASQSEIGKANRAWGSWTGAIDSSTRSLARATSHPWVLKVQAAQALAAARALAAELAALHDKTITISARHTGGHVVTNADGGTVPKTGLGYADRHLRLLADGEEVISNRFGQADRHRSLLKAINAGRMADGGSVGISAPVYVTNGGVATTAKHTTDALVVLKHSLDEATKSLDKERKQRDALVQARQQLVSTVRDNFRSQFLGVQNQATGDPWSANATTGSGYMDPAQILHQDINDAREYRRDIRRLRKRGLSKAALGTITTLDEAQQAVGLSDKELHEISRLYALRQRASQHAGQVAGNLRYGEQIAESNHHLKDIKREVHHLNERIHAIERERAKRAKELANAVAKGVNKGATVGTRRHRPHRQGANSG